MQFQSLLGRPRMQCVHASQQMPEFGKQAKHRISKLTKKKELMEAQRAKQLWTIAKALDGVIREEMNVLRGSAKSPAHDGEIHVDFVRPPPDVDGEAGDRD